MTRFGKTKKGKPPKPKKQPGHTLPRPVQEAEGPENEALEAEIRGLSSLSPDDFNKKFEKMLVRKLTFCTIFGENCFQLTRVKGSIY